MTPILWGVLVYVAAQLALGLWISRRVASEDDYWLAGRKLGPGLALFSIFATWFGAESCIGAAAALYDEGLAGGSQDPFGYGIAILLLGLLLARPLWERKLTTLPDLFRRRYSPRVEWFAVLLMVPTSVLWAAAQIRAFGQVLSSSSSFGLEATIAAAALVVIVYTSAGGLLADAVTDFLQGLVLIVCLLLLAAALHFDGALGFDAALAAVDPARLSIFTGASPLDDVERWAIPVIGSLVAQELISRVSASRTARVARNASIGAALLYLAVGLIPALIGLAGPALAPDLEDSEQLLPHLAQMHLHPLVAVAFVGALVSAILSTVDSALLAASSLVAHNLVGPLHTDYTEQRKLRVARAATLACGAAAYLLARSADSVYELVESSSAFGSAGIVVATGFALFAPRFGGAIAAGAALAVGTATWLGSEAGWFELRWPYLCALGGAALAYVLFAALDARRRSPETAAGA